MSEWLSIRKVVLKRDQLKCKLCGKSPSSQVHHINPRKNGGTNNLNNLITLCGKCHMLLSPVPDYVISKVWKIPLDKVNSERIKTQRQISRLSAL
jgi:hypothetical protein